MKLVFGLILITTISSFGQTLNHGTARVDNKMVSALSTHIDSDAIETLIEKLRKELGPEGENNGSGVAWTKIEKPSWTKDKVSIRLTMLREGAEIIVLISCVSSKGKDLLRPKTDSQIEIVKYFEEKLTN
ncbi:MAG TPA: hypothetical protein PLJ60_09140 [Chryseolinea sp.]|nr:hypothetical protein [Chryseolinea sp.]